MEPALRYCRLSSPVDIQITDAYSTDAELAQENLEVLEDDKQLFPPYQGHLMKVILRNILELKGFQSVSW